MPFISTFCIFILLINCKLLKKGPYVIFLFGAQLDYFTKFVCSRKKLYVEMNCAEIIFKFSLLKSEIQKERDLPPAGYSAMPTKARAGLVQSYKPRTQFMSPS